MMFTQMNQEMNEERGSAINPFLCVAMTMNPSMTVRDEEGNYIGAYEGSTLNPLRDIMTDYNRVRMTRMFSTGYASIEPLKGLKLKETISYDYTTQKIPDTITRLVRQALKVVVTPRQQKGLSNMENLSLLLL